MSIRTRYLPTNPPAAPDADGLGRHLQALAHLLHAAIYVWDPGEDVVHQSQLHKAWFGEARDGGRWLARQCAGSDRGRLIRAHSEVLSGKSGGWQLCYTAVIDGREIRVFDRARSLGPPDHRIVGIIQPLEAMYAQPLGDDERADQPNHLTQCHQIIEALSVSEQHYRLLAENVTDLISLHEPGGDYKYLSPAALNLLGYEPHELVGVSPLNWVHPGDRDFVAAQLEKLRREGNPLTVEFRVLRRDGRYLWISSTARALRGPRGQVEEVLIISRDISHVRQGQMLEQLDRTLAVGLSSARRLQTAVDLVVQTLDEIPEVSASALYLANDQTGRFEMAGSRGVPEGIRHSRESFSPEAPLIAHCLHGRAQYGNYLDLIPKPEDRDHQARLKAAAVIPVHFDGQVIASIKAASRDVTSFSTPVRNTLESIASHLGATIVRIRAEEKLRQRTDQLRSLASQLAVVEERQRRQIATGLHDRVGQTLAALKISAGLLQRSLVDSRSRGSAEQITHMLDDAMREIRTLTFELCPPVLYELGLEAAISWLLEQLTSQHDIHLHLDDDAQRAPLSEDLLGLVFQITRELLTNVIKHAQATEARVRIRNRPEAFVLTVRDDGRGFDPVVLEEAHRCRGFGLFSIRERLGQFGGDLHIRSSPGSGATVTIHLPWSQEST
jgi:PAS domain S-box-containing protein